MYVSIGLFANDFTYNTHLVSKSSDTSIGLKLRLEYDALNSANARLFSWVNRSVTLFKTA